MSSARAWLVNLLALAAAILIVTSFFVPVWSLSARAVQYEQEFPEGLKVYVSLTRVRGDLNEFEIMNKWIGAHFPKTVPEHSIFPVAFGALALLCLASIFTTTWKARTLRLALVLLLASGIAGAASLQWRLYTFGHEREANAPIAVPDFTVPLVGPVKLYNWRISTGFSAGTYTMLLAAVLVGLACVVTPGTPGTPRHRQGRGP